MKPKFLIPFIFLLLLTFLPASLAKAAAPPEAFFAQADAYFRAQVREGLFDYRKASRDQAPLRLLLQAIATADLKGASADEKKAFYLNAYNLLVVRAVLDRYPLGSVKEVPGFFDERRFAVAGERLTLNELENQKLREPYGDPRVHFALVCGARGCPPLPPGAYLPASLDRQLTERTRQAFNDPSFVRVNPGKKQVLLSEIFKWYASDFPAGAKGLITFLNTYRSAPVPTNFHPGYYPYDWSLNEVRSGK